MPNYIKNVLTLNGEPQDIKSLLDLIGNEDKEALIDFNKITPMPEDLSVESGSRGDTGFTVLTGKCLNMFMNTEEILERFWKLTIKEKQECIDLGMKYIQNKENYGHSTWYDWCIENWGTKWNASDQSLEGNALTFTTAWNSVINLLIKLSIGNPNVELDYKFADEDTGSNVGHITISNGNITLENIPENQSKEAYDMAFELRPHYKEDYQLIDGKYEYKENEN